MRKRVRERENIDGERMGERDRERERVRGEREGQREGQRDSVSVCVTDILQTMRAQR